MIQLVTISTDELKSLIKDSVSELLQGIELPHPDPNSNHSEFLTRKQTAEKLHISLTTLDTYTRIGILKAGKVGSRVLYSSTQIDEFISGKLSQVKN